jgi:hypothetical protein
VQGDTVYDVYLLGRKYYFTCFVYLSSYSTFETGDF